MALLKSGSTVGGNLILHQGNLPLYPAGDSIYHKNFKIYTEHDKPTPEELNIFTKNQINLFYGKLSSGVTESWFKVGTAKLAQNGNTVSIIVNAGKGYNGESQQNNVTFITIRTGNNQKAVNAKGRISMSIRSMCKTGFESILGGAIVETSADNYDVYLKVAAYSTNGVYTISSSSVESINDIWKNAGEAVETVPANVMDVSVSTLYSTENKPSKTDVGLSNVSNDPQVKKAGDTMTGALSIQTTGQNSLLTLKGESPNALVIERTNANQNVSIALRHTGGTRYLGFGLNGRLHWGVNADTAINGMVYTTEFKPNWQDVQAWRQSTSELNNTTNLNDVVEPGSYYQPANANALSSLNYPEQTAGTLNVYRSGSNGWGVTQDYKLWYKNITYTRCKTSVSTWSEWSKTYSEHNKPTNNDLNLVSRSGDTMTGTLTMNANIDAWNREVHAGTIILGETGNRLARTYIAQWADPASKNHRFEVYASGNNAERTRKNIIAADITNVNETSASLRVIVAGDLKTDGALQTDGSLKFNPASNSKSYFTARTWGDNGNRSQILEFADKDGWQFYIQRQESNKQTSASFAGHLTSTASMTVGSSLTVGANATINGGQINLGSSRGAIVINGLPSGTGGFVNQHDAGNLGGLYNEIDDSAPSVYSPLIKQRYKQGGITWSQGTLYNAGSWTVHLKVGTGNNAGDRSWTFNRNGQFASPGNISAGAAVLETSGNIYLPAAKDGFSAGWLLAQINNRINNASNSTTNAVTNVRQGGAVSPGKANEYGPNEAPAGGYLTRAWHDSGTRYGVFFTYRVLQIQINGTWRNIGR